MTIEGESLLVPMIRRRLALLSLLGLVSPFQIAAHPTRQRETKGDLPDTESQAGP